MALRQENYRDQLQALLPTGAAWTRESDAALTGLLDGIAEELARVDERGDALMIETDPRAATETLVDWEQTWGLPDGCVTADPTEAGRRLALHQRVASLGGQSAEYFVGMTAMLGYDALIDSFSPTRVAFSIPRPIANLSWAFGWRVSILGPVNTDDAPVYASSDLACVINRLKPAHTVVSFDWAPDPEPTLFFDFRNPPDGPMHRVDTPGNDDGLWRDGDPAIGQQGTILESSWLNDVQENICRVIEGAGDELEKGDFNQLKLAIQAMIASALSGSRLPIATLILVDGSPAVPPTGFVRINTEYLKDDWPALVAHYTTEGRLIAGSTGAHFRTPNYEGRFFRATSSDNSVDPDGPRAAGSLQGDAFPEHSHTLPSRSNANTGNDYVEDADGSGTVGSAATGMAGSGTETRPKNVAVTPFILAR